MKPFSPSVQPLRFVHRGAVVSVDNVPPSRTLLELLREDLGLVGTKEGCAEGDCGACTVVLAETDTAHPTHPLRYRAVNSCIQLAHAAHGRALWTAQDLACDPLIDRQGAALHPVQQALLDCHGSQCGFCTPGFVMSLFGMYQNRVACGTAVTREAAQAELTGNLCRCTGYRPILDAAQHMAALPAARVDEAAVQALLAQASTAPPPEDAAYLAPTTLAELLQVRTRHPEAQLVAGCTDVGLWITKGQQRYPRVLDMTRVAELRLIDGQDEHIAIGAAVTLTDAFTALQHDRPALRPFLQRFAALPVRNAGTLGGNVANGSPIGDSMPLLLALGAQLVLVRWNAPTGTIEQRELPLHDFYTGYRQNQLHPDEVLGHIRVPRPGTGEWSNAYKVSKRQDDDISAVALAISLQVAHGSVQRIAIGCGGVAATPVRAPRTEAALIGQPWAADTVRGAMAVLAQEFNPIADMRASAAYRREVLAQLLWRAWLEHSHGNSDEPAVAANPPIALRLDALDPTSTSPATSP